MTSALPITKAGHELDRTMTTLPIRAVLYDLARSQRCRLDSLIRVVDGIAELGLNMLLLNLEHRFDFPSEPGLAPAGSLRADEARRLVEHGRTRGVDVVPQINLLGHCEGIAALERYAHLSCDPFDQSPWSGSEQLNFELPESRDLVRQLIDDVCSAFPGDYLHLGGDEVRWTQMLFPGNGPERSHAIAEHFRFLVEQGRRTGRRLMLWADMPLHDPELLHTLPKDVMLIDWHYGPQGTRKTLSKLRDQGFAVLSAPSVNSYAGFGLATQTTRQNLETMIRDARELNLHGFVVTTWELSSGTGFDQAWPWLEMTVKTADGQHVPDTEIFLSTWAEKRYGVPGAAFARLQILLGPKFDGLIRRTAQGYMLACRLRKSLFRAADPFSEIARPIDGAQPKAAHRCIWEPSPFHTWLLLRPVVSQEFLNEFQNIAQQANELADQLRTPARHAEELVPLLGQAAAMNVLVERLILLEQTKAFYHKAAQAQGKDATAFTQSLEQVANHLEQLRPGIEVLQGIVEKIDSSTGLDAGEHHWLELHLQSLDSHITALRNREFESESLLEFGEFLRRPACVTQRLTWR